MSKEYSRTNRKLEWVCAKGHTFSQYPGVVIQGGWCRKCGREKRNEAKLSALIAVASSRAGKLISTKYIRVGKPLEWECSKGHRWMAMPSNILHNKTWCPVCTKSKSVIGQMQELAESKDGTCLSTTYQGANYKLIWQCSRGHRFNLKPSSVKEGSWCIQCRQEPMLHELKDLAQERGGRLISKKYKNSRSPLEWECAKGHQWKSKASTVKHSKTWCPTCAGKTKPSMEQLQELVESRGGKCLSTKYHNSLTKLKWQCSRGHRFELKPSAIKNGHWCSQCSREALKEKDLTELKKLARSRGGKLLSTKYLNNYTPLEWECSKGHRWMSKASNVKHGETWCPVCYRTNTRDRIFS